MNFIHKDLENPHYVKWADFLSGADDWSLDRIESYNLEQVRSIAAHAYYNINGYRGLFDANGVKPGEIRNLKDFRKFPFTSKETFRDNLENFSFRTPDCEYVTTGGSTGVPMGMYRDKVAFARELASKAHQYHRAGWREGQRQIVFRGLQIKSQDSIEFAEEFNELRCSTYEFGSDRMETYRQKAMVFQPEWIRCYPSSGYVFAKYLKDSGKHFPAIKGMLCSSEQLYDFQKQLFLDIFGKDIKIFAHYGHYEMAALAGFCEFTDDYHVLPQYGYVELLDKNDQPVTKPGDVGEIVATSFLMTATPFIRYRTQDLAVYKGFGCQKCGRPYQIWERIEGRLQELIVTRTGRLISTSMLNMHDDSYDHLKQFQFHQQNRETVTFKFIPKPTFDITVENEVYNKMKSKLGNDINLKMQRVEEIPLTKRGKHRLLIQELDLSSSHPSLEKPICL